jgi:hypothetical protein
VEKLAGLKTYTVVLLMLPWVSLWMIVPYLQMRLITRNGNWILSLPISKKNIVVLNYLLNFVNNLAGIISVWAIYLLLIQIGPVDSEGKYGMPSVWKTFATFGKSIPEQMWDPYVVMFLLLFANWIHYLGIFVSRYPIRWEWSSKWNRRLIGILLLGCIFYWLFRDYVITAWALFGLVSLFFFSIAQLSCMEALGVSRRQTKTWLLISLILITAEMGLLFVIAKKALSTQDPRRIVSGIKFLGPFSGRVSESNLSSVLALDLEPSEIVEIGTIYKDRYAAGALVKQDPIRELRFQSTIEKKTSRKSIEASADLFDPSFLSYQDVESFYARLASIPGGAEGGFTGIHFFSAKIGTRDLVRMINSKASSDLAKQYALVKLQIYRDPAVIPDLVKNVVNLPDQLKEIALRTLSLYLGRKLGWDDYIRIKGGQKNLGQFYKPNCSELKLSKFSDAENMSSVDLNVCLRDKAVVNGEPSVSNKLFFVGWVTKPFDKFNSWMIRKIFAIKEE